MCKHVAAALYGVGARLDERPELLFLLRAVDESELVAISPMSLPMQQGAAAGKRLQTDDISALFGLEMADVMADPPAKPAKAAPRRAARPAPQPAGAAASHVSEMAQAPTVQVFATTKPIKPAVAAKKRTEKAAAPKLAPATKKSTKAATRPPAARQRR